MTTPKITVTPFVPGRTTPEDDHDNKVSAVAEYTHADGTTTQVALTLFQLDDGRIGVGVYPTADRGTVLRWDDGTDEKPTVGQWHDRSRSPR